MAKTIKMDALSASSINNARKQLEKYRGNLEYKCRLIAERLSLLGVEIARLQIANLDAIFTGELIASIRSDYVGSFKVGAIFAVVADSSHAIYVELGTGIVGRESPYPYPLPQGVDWQYASGKTIRQLTDGRYGWFYPSNDGKWYFTEGMPSRPFMYNTRNELYLKAVDVIREVFANG